MGQPDNLSTQPQAESRLPAEPIAVVGMGCRLPGAANPDEFWRLLVDGRDEITEIPADRFDIEAFYDSRPGTPGKTVSRWAGLISDVRGFDAEFFGIAPREAANADPLQRLLLEASWEAMEDAGEVPQQLAGSATAVFIGQSATEYEETICADPSQIDNVYMLLGTGRSVSSGRLSYTLDLRGPSMTVDTACSSGLLAVHLACQSMWRGESTMAFAGGVSLVLSPHGTVGFSQAGMAAADGRCKAFSAAGDGLVRSDGIAVVLLKPLSRARADGNPVYATILGTATGNDGQSSGLLMTPGQAGQEGVLRAAYRQAGVDPRLVQYVETHGTGTVAGDPVEVKALAAVLGEGRDPAHPCALGSVKSNIGHTEAAAGVVSLIKTVLSLRHRAIPASLHAAELNPAIDWDKIPFTVQQELAPWPADGPTLAGVSSFGISGTNVHVVLAGAPGETGTSAQPAAADHRAELLPLSARSPQALADLASAYAEFLADEDQERRPAFADICYTASVRRAHHDHRLAVVAGTAAEAAEQLVAFGSGLPAPAAGARRRVMFVFPGQGGQWAGMGQGLMAQEPVFAAAVRDCAKAMEPYLDWSLTHLIEAGARDKEWSAIDRVQPALFAMQVALVGLWRSWGIAPDGVIGHSMGEVAAAYVAGALTLDDAARVICRRSALMRRISGQGAMVLVALSAGEAGEALRAYDGRLSVAVCNSPSATVISGEAAAVAEFMSAMEAEGVFCRPVEVDVASHSPQVDCLRDDLLTELAGLEPRSGELPVYSTVEGSVGDGSGFDAGYWMSNLRDPVLFAPAVEQAASDGYSVFVEISPHPMLFGSVGEICRDRSPGIAVFASTRREEDERTRMLDSLAGLYRLGLPVAWDRLHPGGGRSVRLPRYPWQHETHWSERANRWLAGQDGVGRRRADGRLAHPLLNHHFRSAYQPGLHVFQTALGPQLMSYLTDHRVQGTVVFPGAGYLEMALAAADEVLGSPSAELTEVSFSAPLVLSGAQLPELRLELTVEGTDRASFAVFSVARGGADADPVLHASGMVWLVTGESGDVAAVDPDSIRASCPEVISQPDFYRPLHRTGLGYGPAFQGVTEVYRRVGEALASIRPPEQLAELDRYLVHPAVLDACFQVLNATIPEEELSQDATSAIVLAGLGRLRLAGQAGPPAYCHARLTSASDENRPGRASGDITVTDESGRVVMSVESLTIARIDQAGGSAGQDVTKWMYTLDWEPTEPAPEPSLSRTDERWLIMSDAGGAGDALAAELESAGALCVRVTHGQVTHGHGHERVAPGHYQVDPGHGTGWQQLLEEVAEAGPVTGIVHLWSLDIPEPATLTRQELQAGQQLACTSLMHLVQALPSGGTHPAPRVFLVTAGVQAIGNGNPAVAVAQAPLWGMFRVLAQEQTELRCTMVDLGLVPDRAEVAGLCRELGADLRDQQVALRGGDRYVARLVRGGDLASDPAAPADIQRRVTVSTEQPIELVNPTPGLLDNLDWAPCTRRPPGRGEVEIAVRAVGLTFHDVLLTLDVNLGQEPGSFLAGYECSGVITAIGPDVTDVAIGQEVLCISCPAFRSYLTTSALLVRPKPAGFSFEEAAAMPHAFATAHHSLVTLARLSAGERVLIHSAATGTGLAAVRIAQGVGAEIFATAGTPEKREFLRSLGVEQVFDSRSPAFVGEIMELTGGQGVDVVLNSLAGPMMDRSLDAVAIFGRFVQIGTRDFYATGSRMGLHHFRKSLSFFAVDLKRMLIERPAAFGAVQRAAMEFVAEREIPPLPVAVFGPDEVTDAFRLMASARHTGKIVISLAGRSADVAAAPPPVAGLRADATYLITGGLGGLGIMVAGWLADQGARSLVLVGRRSPSAAAAEAVAAMRERGVTITVVAADITDEEQVLGVLRMIGDELPPLRGIIHSAVVLDDGILAQLTEQRLLEVLAPKVLGAWYLHHHTREVPLDFFALFSSAGGLLGSAGQANYCAANTFLDALALLRRSQGRPALSIGWSAWAQVGLAAEQVNRGKRLASRGMASMLPEQGLDALGRILGMPHPYVAVIPLDIEVWFEFHPGARDSGLFDRIPQLSASVGRDATATAVRQEIESAEPGRRRQLIESYLGKRGARILGFADGLDTDKSLQRLGLDSLMAVELRNAIEADLGVAMPVMNLLQGDSIGELAAAIDDQLLTVTDQAPPDQDLGSLSDQEVDDLLAHLEARQHAGAAGD